MIFGSLIDVSTKFVIVLEIVTSKHVCLKLDRDWLTVHQGNSFFLMNFRGVHLNLVGLIAVLHINYIIPDVHGVEYECIMTVFTLSLWTTQVWAIFVNSIKGSCPRIVTI